MKRLLLLIGFWLATTMGWAGACGSGTLATYATPGFSCTIGGLTFSNFTYTATASGGATLIPASGVAVIPVVSPSAGFQFSAPWNVVSGQSLDSLISFTVTAQTGNISALTEQIGGVGSTGSATVSAAETATTSGSPLSLFLFSNAGGTSLSQSATFAGVTSLTMTDGIAVNGNGGTAALSLVTELF